MKPRIFSHLAAVAIGIALAGAAGSGFRRAEAPAARKSGRATMPAVTDSQPRKKAARPVSRKLTSADYRRAWDSLSLRPMPRAERIPLQRRMLESWAEIDLQAALDAAMSEAWGGGDNFIGLSSFKQVFIDRPMDSWALIQSGRYGVGSQLLRNMWVAAVMEQDKLLVASMLSEFPGRMGDRVMPDLMWGYQFDKQKEALAEKIIAQAGDEHDTWLQELCKELDSLGDPADLRDRWTTLPSGPSRTLAMLEWSASLRKLGAEALTAELASVPAGAEDDVTKAIISQLDYSSPGLLPALDFALASDCWPEVAPKAESYISNFARNTKTESRKLAEWAVTLPERPDTVEIYHKAIGRYIADDLPRAREWFESMPEDSWHRDNGLAEFSQQALWGKNDPVASQWALDSISDPAIQAKAQQWRLDWEKQTGRSTR
jgi:hypothetical protein